MTIYSPAFNYKDYLQWDKWEEEFQPIKDGDALKDFWTDVPEGTDPHLVWTEIQGDYSSWIVPGYARVNRLAVYVCAKPWTEDTPEVLLGIETQCECYKEEGYGPFTFPNGHEYWEDGDRNCKECEGYGLTTIYNDDDNLEGKEIM